MSTKRVLTGLESRLAADDAYFAPELGAWRCFAEPTAAQAILEATVDVTCRPWRA